MTTQINLSEADFTLIRSKLIEFLKRDESPFKSYNFNNSALSGILDVCAYTAAYMASYLNLSVNELFLETAILEKSVYRLIHNFNYIPKLNGPANAYLKVRYYRNKTDNIKITYADLAGAFVDGETITGSTSSATGVIDVNDTVNKILYVRDIEGTFQVAETITGSTSSTTATTTIVGTVESDYYSTDDDSDKKFNLYFNWLQYTDDYKAIPTFRDKYVEDKYLTLNLSTDDVTTENISIFKAEPYVDTTNNIRYLQAIVPLYQGEWKNVELTNIDNLTFQQNVYLSADGTIDTDMWGDKVIEDTIRVYVQETDSQWYEYSNLREGIFDHENQRCYQLKYSEDYGIYIKFDIDGYSRAIDDTENIRIRFIVTEGDDINEENGTNTFDSDQDNLDKINYMKIVLNDDGNNSDIFELSEGEMISGDQTYFEALIIDSANSNGNSTYLNNGTAKQTVEDIREAAPLFYSTQGRAVTENDYNSLLRRRYTEYYDVRAWGGNKEFVDLHDIIEDEISPPLSSTYDNEDFVNAVKQTMGVMYKPSVYDNPYLSVRSATQNTLEEGTHIRDLGYVYFTIAKNDFQFETNDPAINDVKSYLDKYKILSIYYKYMYPTYVIIQPKINLKLKSAYTKSFQVRTIKQDIYDYINIASKTKSKFYVSSLYSEINAYDEVDYVQDISYVVKTKVKNQSATEYTYVRLYAPLSGEINTEIQGVTFVTESQTAITDPNDINYGLGIVWINGVDCGRINYETGIIRFQYDFGVDEYYIENILISGNKVFSVKDCYYGIESLSDITITVE